MIDFVVPAYNSEKTLEKTIRSILSLASRDTTREIIVVDNNSTDQTAHIAKTLGARVIPCKLQGRAHARNEGALRSTAPWIAYVDSDTVLEKDWLQRLAPFTQVESVAMIQGAIIPSGSRLLDQYRRDFSLWNTKRSHLAMNASGFPPFIDTAACLLRKSAFAASGGFDPQFSYNEDFDLSARLVERGYSLVAREEARAFKSESRNMAQYLARTFTYNHELHRLDPMVSSGLTPSFSSTSWESRLFHRLNLSIARIAAWLARSRVKLHSSTVLWNAAGRNLLLPKIQIRGQFFRFSPSARMALSSSGAVFYLPKSPYRLRVASSEFSDFIAHWILGEEPPSSFQIQESDPFYENSRSLIENAVFIPA